MNTNYTHEIAVSSTPSETYQALTTGFDKWWTTSCNAIYEIGEKITFRFGASYWVMQVTKLIPNRLVEFACIEAHHEHDGLPSSIINEWQGTKLQWEINMQDDKTNIVFVHEGLVPSLDCFEVCEKGWDYYFANSLKQYLETGVGSPFTAA